MLYIKGQRHRYGADRMSKKIKQKTDELWFALHWQLKSISIVRVCALSVHDVLGMYGRQCNAIAATVLIDTVTRALSFVVVH